LEKFMLDLLCLPPVFMLVFCSLLHSWRCKRLVPLYISWVSVDYMVLYPRRISYLSDFRNLNICAILSSHLCVCVCLCVHTRALVYFFIPDVIVTAVCIFGTSVSNLVMHIWFSMSRNHYLQSSERFKPKTVA
jgi:hypothetical protein